MKKVIKADGQINFVNEKYLDSVLEDTDTVDEDYVVDRTAPTITEEDIAADNQRTIRNTAKKYLAVIRSPPVDQDEPSHIRVVPALGLTPPAAKAAFCVPTPALADLATGVAVPVDQVVPL